MIKKEVYLEKTIGYIPRLLSCLDKNPVSKTFGCFDRSYWHYKTSDFPCARMQEAVLTLALLYNLKHKLNTYYKNKTLLLWIEAAIEFWKKIQNSNGSFDEWYKKENSYVATAFTTYAISETLLLLKKDIPTDCYLESLTKAGDWLLTRHEEKVQNQESGAALALLNIHLLTCKGEYKLSAQKKIERLIRNQTEEGWFFEYGGFDVGYSSLAIDYLAKYYIKTKDNQLFESLKKATNFLKEFVDFSITPGGCYGSRNTRFLIPSGFEILSKRENSSLQLAHYTRYYLSKNQGIIPSAVDDRYLLYMLYTFLHAYQYAEDKVDMRLNSGSSSFKNFKNAKIWIKDTPYFKLIVNYAKGGAFKLSFKKSNKILNDCGIYVEKDNKKLFSGWLNSSDIKHIDTDSINLSGNLGSLSQELMTPFKAVLKNSFGLIPLSSSQALKVKNILRKRLIEPPKKMEVSYSRKIIFKKDKIQIEDDILGLSNIKKGVTGFDASVIYIPSSEYFSREDLDFKPIVYKDIPNFRLKRVYDKQGNLLICEIK